MPKPLALPLKKLEKVQDDIHEFIIHFNDHAVNDEAAEEDKDEAYLKGVAKGMWIILDFFDKEIKANINSRK